MYGVNELNDDEIQQLLGFQLPEEQQQAFQAQETPQLAQGLLGDTGDEQQAKLKDLAAKGTATAAQARAMTQQSPGGNDLMAQRMAQAPQGAQQLMQQQQQKERQAGQILGMLAKMYLPF